MYDKGLLLEFFFFVVLFVGMRMFIRATEGHYDPPVSEKPVKSSRGVRLFSQGEVISKSRRCRNVAGLKGREKQAGIWLNSFI